MAALTDNGCMRGKHVLLGVTGGIAAYKSADLVRRLMERGAEVQVVMTALMSRNR
jgi:phosphopantothenoylcysteine decarboxylase / phosphopantothenate---cysteine ligase